MVKVLNHQKMAPIPGSYSQELKELAGEMLSRDAQLRPSVHKILEKPFIKKYFSKTLEKTINLYDENYASQEGLKKSSKSSSINRLFRKRSSTNLSASVQGKSNGLSMGSEDYLKMV